MLELSEKKDKRVYKEKAMNMTHCDDPRKSYEYDCDYDTTVIMLELPAKKDKRVYKVSV